MIRHRLLCLGYFDFGSVGLFNLGFLSLFAAYAQHGQNAAADEQSSQPTDEVAAVTGLGSTGILRDDRILAALGAANGAFLVLNAGSILGSGLVDHPLEAVCCCVGLGSYGVTCKREEDTPVPLKTPAAVSSSPFSSH